VTVDLRGWGAALGLYAAASHTTTSALVRRAVAELLEHSGVTVVPSYPSSTNGEDSDTVKLTIRIPRRIASKIAARAAATGLPQGICVSSLVEGAPELRQGEQPTDAVRTLAASTSELVVLMADLRRVVHLLRTGSSTSLEDCQATLSIVGKEVRLHLVHASRLLEHLSPLAAAISRRLAKARANEDASP
jgi:hypothetical protein